MGKHKHSKRLEKHKKKKEKRKHKSSTSSESDEWVEKESLSCNTIKPPLSEEPSSTKCQTGVPKKNESTQSFVKYCKDETPQQKRDDWMSLPTNYSSYSNLDRRTERDVQKQVDKMQQIYDPSTCNRELNPYWKDGGDGLPKFRKPNDVDHKDEFPLKSTFSKSQSWRKGNGNANTKEDRKKMSSSETKSSEISSEFKEDLSSEDLNKIASKLVKAEIMGNTKLIEELKERLEKARQLKDNQKDTNEDVVLLTHTDSKGYSRPVRQTSDTESMPSGSRPKKQKVETHRDGQRLRYFPDDDKYSLKQMFEKEKYVSAHDQNQEFMKMAGSIRKGKDDFDEVFEDKVRYKSDSRNESESRSKAIRDHQKISRSLDNCNKCIQSDNMLKHLMISMGESIYLSVPHHEPLVSGHCALIPVRHVQCATQLDENEWQELMVFRKALTKMYNSLDQNVVFFEVAMYLHKFPHMKIECIPLPREQGDLAPFYFKKAIDESEFEWSQNKKLVDLKGRNVQKAIPKGLPYFSVSFGMEEGFAHVIEEEKYFPQNFAQEIIGGMLDLDHSKWRKPRSQNFDDQSKRIRALSKLWSNFDITRNDS